MATREWDASTYDALPLPHVAWGQRVLDRMRLEGDERVLDAGCGTGRDGEALLGAGRTSGSSGSTARSR